MPLAAPHGWLKKRFGKTKKNSAASPECSGPKIPSNASAPRYGRGPNPKKKTPRKTGGFKGSLPREILGKKKTLPFSTRGNGNPRVFFKRVRFFSRSFFLGFGWWVSGLFTYTWKPTQNPQKILSIGRSSFYGSYLQYFPEQSDGFGKPWYQTLKVSFGLFLAAHVDRVIGWTNPPSYRKWFGWLNFIPFGTHRIRGTKGIFTYI